ncbi:MAG: S8 family serine peptidase, partial [Planctomycetota bacterium]
MKHNALYDADVLFSDQTDGYWGISEHATSIAGILLGLEENVTYPATGRFSYRGICPDASVNTYEFNQFAKEYLFDKHPIEEDIILLSLGHEQEEWWTRSLEQASESQDFLVVASTGNGAD